MRLATWMEIQAGKKLAERTEFQGLQLSIENKKGSVRKGEDPHFGPWEVEFQVPYGYIRNTMGSDGQHVDVFLGPNPKATMAYVVHIRKTPDYKKYDEDKALLGFDSAQEAKRTFLQHYNDERFFGGMEAMPMEEFKEKVLGTKGRPGPLISDQRRLSPASQYQMAVQQKRDGGGAGKEPERGRPQTEKLPSKKPPTAVAKKPPSKKKIAADSGEPAGPYPYYSSIEPVTRFHPPSLKHPQRVPTDSPGETDDRFMDVTNRDPAMKFRLALAKKHGFDAKYKNIRTTSVGGWPAHSVGGFG